jgi:hypothetical protein
LRRTYQAQSTRSSSPSGAQVISGRWASRSDSSSQAASGLAVDAPGLLAAADPDLHPQLVADVGQHPDHAVVVDAASLQLLEAGDRLRGAVGREVAGQTGLYQGAIRQLAVLEHGRGPVYRRRAR